MKNLLIENELPKKMNKIFIEKIPLSISAGRFIIKTISSRDELSLALKLRYQVFQVEMVGHENLNSELEDCDEFDHDCDHLAVIHAETGKIVATCRLNSSLYGNKFYSEGEFNCRGLIERDEVKLEIGRVCVHQDFRNSIIIILLWKAIAEYMVLSRAKVLFGCGSIMTQSPQEAMLLYRYLIQENKVRHSPLINPTLEYQSLEFNDLLKYELHEQALSASEKKLAQTLLPSLCRSYFDIGCYVPGPPAFDREFKCIDFLTILEIHELHPRILEKVSDRRKS